MLFPSLFIEILFEDEREVFLDQKRLERRATDFTRQDHRRMIFELNESNTSKVAFAQLEETLHAFDIHFDCLTVEIDVTRVFHIG